MAVAGGFLTRCVQNSGELQEAAGLISGSGYVNAGHAGQGLGQAFGRGGKSC